MGRRKILLAVVGVVLASACLDGCSFSREEDPEPTMKVSEAVKRVDSVLGDAVKAVHPRLKWRDGPIRTTERRNSFTNTANGELTVGRTRHLRTKVSKRKLAELLTVVDKRWRAAGFKMGQMHAEVPSLSGTASDGCTVKVSMSGFGEVRFDAGVGAVSPGEGFHLDGEEGDTFPKAPDGGPDYTPDVQDSYWSK
ncbi:hypothetical protein ABZ851_03015 [Streptomyces sp. NPDC047049]|uniref:hypothetical protein n=1 Tax=Streptomyces sp. NPDC047049 TaxID=3156688 RepID=UPI0033F1F19F